MSSKNLKKGIKNTRDLYNPKNMEFQVRSPATQGKWRKANLSVDCKKGVADWLKDTQLISKGTAALSGVATATGNPVAGAVLGGVSQLSSDIGYGKCYGRGMSINTRPMIMTTTAPKRKPRSKTTKKKVVRRKKK